MSEPFKKDSFDEGTPNRAEQIRSVIESLHRRRSHGEIVPDDVVLAEYPQYLPELVNELRKLAIITRRDQPTIELTTDDPESAETKAWESKGSVGRSLEIRCPLCHEPLAIFADGSLDELQCHACRSQFSLVGQESDSPDQQAVTRIAHFELLSRLGMGSFGTVWKARDVQLDRIVALKIPRRGRLDANQVDEFLREARIVAKLRHPHIVNVYEISRDGDNVYIVSDYVEGVSLEAYKDMSPMTQREAAELLAIVCDALHFAHQAGVVHRDLKPSNILIDAKGQPHIVDFGLAKRTHDEVTITESGSILGTPAYMSPEQARGDSHLADCRTDVYSVGVILFELLTDFVPFRGNIVALTHHAIHTEPTSPRRLNALVSRDLETICLKCLEKDPTRRYQSAADLADELRRFLEGDAILARPMSGRERLWRWCLKNPRIPALSATVLLVMLAAYGIAWYRFEKQIAQTDRALTEQALTSVRFAAEAVALQAGADFENYVDMAETAARDPILIRELKSLLEAEEMGELRTKLNDPASEGIVPALEAARHQLTLHPQRAKIQTWNAEFGRNLPVFASFVLLADGLQISRYPEEQGDTVGRNYAWRAYFHGGEHDQPRSWRPSTESVLNDTRLSPPFVSEYTDEWVVVVSTPIFDADQPNKPLGVVGLMVRLGSFVKLPGNAGPPQSAADRATTRDSRFAVLIDTRPSHRGQILQHPLLNELEDLPPPTSHTTLSRRTTLSSRTQKSARRQLLDRSQVEPQLRASLEGNALETNYRDPYGQVAEKYDLRWLAAQQPVYVGGTDTGLKVIVQESYDQVIGHPLGQMHHSLFLLSLVTLGLSATVIVPLWALVVRLVR